jgi:hypothetical protein
VGVLIDEVLKVARPSTAFHLLNSREEVDVAIERTDQRFNLTIFPNDGDKISVSPPSLDSLGLQSVSNLIGQPSNLLIASFGFEPLVLRQLLPDERREVFGVIYAPPSNELLRNGLLSFNHGVRMDSW